MDAERKRKGEKRDFKVKYIGESARSGFERGEEHLSDYKNLNETSHLLKHYVLYHQQEIKKEEMEFGMRVRETFHTAIERQVAEAVTISFENKKGKILMNSKGEYNRCYLPRISTKSKKKTEEEKEVYDEEEKFY